MKIKPVHLVIGLAVIGLGIYLWTQLEYYEEEVDLGYSLSAMINPYLAAERFLEEVGHQVQADYQLDLSQSLPADASLFISNANHVLDERRADSLIEWMQTSGGHVIIAAQVLNEGETDVFLNHFGVEKFSYDDEQAVWDEDDTAVEEEQEEESLGDRIREANEQLRGEEAQRKAREQAEEEGRLDTVAEQLIYEEDTYDADNIATLTFEGVGDEIDILIDREEYLYHPGLYEEDENYYDYEPFYWEGTDGGVAFMQFSVGEGLLTVIGDGSIWDNEHIGLFDHAYLLQVLTDNTNQVVFLRGAEVPGLLDMAWANFPELCVILALILFLWLFYRSRRFGPIMDTSDRGRRSFREHLSAVGDFYWRHRQREELLNHARDAVWREFNQKYFAVRDRKPAEKFAHLASLTDQSEDSLRAMLQGDPPQDEFKFYQLIQSLQKLRKKL